MVVSDAATLDGLATLSLKRFEPLLFVLNSITPLVLVTEAPAIAAINGGIGYYLAFEAQ